MLIKYLKYFVILIILLILILGVILIKKVDPMKVNFFPPCLFNKLTGLYCPGCGMTRATHALLNFRIKEAFDFNPLFFILLPFLAYMGIMQSISLYKYQKMSVIKIPYWIVVLIAVVVVAFFILRNIPYEPFIFLAP